VRSGYARITTEADLFAKARELSVRTIIFDVEPLVTYWHSGQKSLDRGVARILHEVKVVRSVRAVVFAANSARRSTALPACDGIQVRYLAQAGKPLRTAPYQICPGRAPWQVISFPPTGYSPIASIFRPALHAAADRCSARAGPYAPVGRAGASGAVPAASLATRSRPARLMTAVPG
jgi:hypothetical protein